LKILPFDFLDIVKGGNLMEKYYEKRFPADTTLEKLTFLNNRKIDAELYAYL